jgi:alkylation response protein AidB-like acyl-CoA dehydrogenase
MVQMMIDTALPEATAREQELIARADDLGRTLLAPNAAAVDAGTLSARANLQALAAAGLAGLRVPRQYGGDEVARAVYLRVLEGLSYGDGTTPFIIAQHYGTSVMVARSPNEALRARVLPAMASGDTLCGFGVSHIRRQGRPALAATPQGDDYRLDGVIPWMTGEGLFSHVVIGATLPDGDTLLSWAPFASSDGLRLDPPMELVAMNGARTVAAACEGLRVRAEDVLAGEPAGSRTRANTTTIPCLYGLARASVDDLEQLAARRAASASAAAAARLGERLERERRAFYAALPTLEDGPSEAPLAAARAAATQLAFDAIVALTVAVGGGANARTHPAQRRLREASVFATWGLSVEAVNAAVTRLSGDQSPHPHAYGV